MSTTTEPLQSLPPPPDAIFTFTRLQRRLRNQLNAAFQTLKPCTSTAVQSEFPTSLCTLVTAASFYHLLMRVTDASRDEATHWPTLYSSPRIKSTGSRCATDRKPEVGEAQRKGEAGGLGRAIMTKTHRARAWGVFHSCLSGKLKTCAQEE